MQELAGDDGRPKGAALHQVPVPVAYVGRTYGELASALLLARGGGESGGGEAEVENTPLPAPWPHEVPLGLLRRKSENRGWRLPYVALHPVPSTVLELTDCVFLLRPR